MSQSARSSYCKKTTNNPPPGGLRLNLPGKRYGGQQRPLPHWFGRAGPLIVEINADRRDHVAATAKAAAASTIGANQASHHMLRIQTARGMMPAMMRRVLAPMLLLVVACSSDSSSDAPGGARDGGASGIGGQGGAAGSSGSAGSAGSSGVGGAGGQSAFQPGACKLSLQLASEWTRSCGSVSVPLQRYGEATDATLDVYVERLVRGQGPVVVYLTGGPGVGIESYAGLGVLQKIVHGLEGELILVEQRGNPLSPGTLVCNPSEDLEDCFVRLDEEQAHPEAYNSVESAADVIDVLDVFGHPDAVVWGHSYGSALAQFIVQHHPSRVSSVILEGVSDPTLSLSDDPMATRLAVLKSFGPWFSAECETEPWCAEAYPDGIDAYAETLAMAGQFEASPDTKVALNESLELSYDDVGEWFLNGMALYDGMLGFVQLAYAFNRTTLEDRSELDDWLMRVGGGDVAAGALAVGTFVSQLRQGFSVPKNAVTSCFDRQGFGNGDICDLLPQQAYAPSLFALTFQSEIQALFFNGDLDTQVLPAEWDSARARFSSVTEAKLADCMGHFVFLNAGACGDELVFGFLGGISAVPQSCEAAQVCGALALTPKLSP